MQNEVSEFKPSISSLSYVHLGDYNPFKLNLLLDLDSTLISSLALNNEVKLVPLELRKKFKRHKMGKYYEIAERPHLQSFLDYCFANFNVSIFTAADMAYATFIVKNIITKEKPSRRLNYFLYGYHSALSESFLDSPKDLRMLWDIFKIPGFDKYNTIIIDDNAQVIRANPKNIVAAPAFDLLNENRKVDYNSSYDNWLLAAPFLVDKRRRELLNDLKTVNNNSKK